MNYRNPLRPDSKSEDIPSFSVALNDPAIAVRAEAAHPEALHLQLINDKGHGM